MSFVSKWEIQAWLYAGKTGTDSGKADLVTSGNVEVWSNLACCNIGRRSVGIWSGLLGYRFGC